MSGMYYDDARGLRYDHRAYCLLCPVCNPCHYCRKKNKKWRVLQSYSPFVGWFLFSLLALLSLYRQHQAKVLGQNFSSTTNELSSMKTQNAQLQVGAFGIDGIST